MLRVRIDLIEISFVLPGYDTSFVLCDMEMLSVLLAICEGNPMLTHGVPLTKGQ